MARQKGFTLVEASVVLGVVLVLSGILVPVVLRYLEEARVARARNDMDVIAGAIAVQLRTFGRRPTQAVPGGPSGVGRAIWYSGGVNPQVHGLLAQPLGAHGHQTFAELFQAAPATGQALFGTPAAGPFSYQGPYLPVGAPIADPWGRAYLILGYNAEGEAGRGPIWVVCAGRGGAIRAFNLIPNAFPGGIRRYREEWFVLNAYRDNLAVRVN